MNIGSIIKSKFSSYAERRLYLTEEMNPIIEYFDNSDTQTQESYERNELLGQGGFGQVYRYRHKLLQMDFAFKVFAPAFSSLQDKHIERFFREARILFKLNHPNIIKVYDLGMINKKPFIRMEYFTGKNLNQVLKEFGILSPSKCLTLIRNIIEAFIYAHEEVGVVHRDLKPSNIMVSNPNQFRIIDFGLGFLLRMKLFLVLLN
jgi:serine/threonine protein kinase